MIMYKNFNAQVNMRLKKMINKNIIRIYIV